MAIYTQILPRRNFSLFSSTMHFPHNFVPSEHLREGVEKECERSKRSEADKNIRSSLLKPIVNAAQSHMYDPFGENRHNDRQNMQTPHYLNRLSKRLQMQVKS